LGNPGITSIGILSRIGGKVYKLVIKGENDILGLISLERISSEWRVHIRLLTVSKDNKGSGKSMIISLAIY